MKMLLEVLALFISLIFIVCLVIISVNISISTKWERIFKGDGRDDR